MRHFLLTTFILMTRLLFSQDTTVTWFKNIDTLSYKVYYTKNEIPKKCYDVIGIHKLKEIANPDEPCALGCVRKKGVPHIRLNWIAKDDNNHTIISVTSGGKGFFNHYYYFDTENGKLNVNELIFRAILTFGQTINRISSNAYTFDD